MDLPNQPLLPDEIRNAFLLTATLRLHEHELPFPPNDPHTNPARNELVKALLFSLRFLLSYNVVLICILAVVSVSYHVGRRRRRKRQKGSFEKVDTNAGNNSSEQEHTSHLEYSSSESSSTLPGTASPRDVKYPDVETEQSPLLDGRRRAGKRWRSIRSSLSAFLMYQPKPISLINRSLPSNITSLVILAFYGLNIFYLFFRIPWQGPALLILSDRFGLLFAANLPLLYMLAAKNQPIRRLTGHSYEALNIFHRRVGEMMCLLALFHLIGFFTVWYTILRPALHVTFFQFIRNRTVWLGLSAFASYELLYFTSLGSFRQRWYELFLASHVFLQLAAAVFLWFHYLTTRLYVTLAMAIFCVDRIVYRAYLNVCTVDATLEILEDGETVLVSSNWAIPPKAVPICSIVGGWRPTDHVFLTVPSLSWTDTLRAHPFTIASAAPNMLAAEPHAWLSLLIRAQNGFSRHLLDFARHNSSVQIRLDGPYGSSRPLERLLDSDLAIVVAGGSGIAVAFPLVWELLYRNDESSSNECIMRRKRTVCLVWVVHSRSHLSWLPQERLNELKELGLELCIPPPTADGGRPDVAGIVQDLVFQHEEHQKSAVIVSGPDGMNRDVRNACAGLVREGLDVGVEVEKFGW